MRFRNVLVYSIATAAVALISPSVAPVLDMSSVAQAANVSVSIGTFYNDLAPHGSWVSYHDSYVFVPARVKAGWRPYTEGHWVHTKRYGWMWVSTEPFGWATYHYGRWGYAQDIGWYWVPGRRWAPAWVAWRRGGDHVVWAPLPPGRGGDVSVEISINDVPDNYWVAVPSRDFLDADLSVVIVHNDRDRVRIVEAARPVGVVKIENNVVVNNVIDVNYVEKTTNKQVKNVEVKETTNPEQAKESNGQVAAFTGEIKEDKGAKPSEVKDVEAVKKERADAGQDQNQQGQDQNQQGQSEQGQQQGKKKQQQAQPEGQEQPTKKKSKAANQQDEQQQAQPEEGQGQQAKKKSKAANQQDEQQQAQPEEGQEQPTKKTRASKQQNEEEQAQPEQGQGQPPKQKSKSSEQPSQQEQGQQGQEQPKGQKKPKGECDPATGEC